MASNSAPSKASPQKLYDEALIYKHDGNDLYKNKEIKKAMRKYHYALLHLRDVTQDKSDVLQSMFLGGQSRDTETSHELKQSVVHLQCDCYNNLAACLLKQDEPNYEKVVSYCDNVLDLQSENSKALYRRGIALYHLKAYDRSLESLKLAQSHSPKPDPSIAKFIALCREKTKSEDNQLKDTYKSMMNALSTKTETECNDT